MMKIKKNRYLGIEILRMILAFWVLIYHCYNKSKKIQKIISSRFFHVPTFMLLSFYYCFPNLSSRNISKIIQRYERLFIPYIIWPFIILIFNNLILWVFKFSLFKRKLLLIIFLFVKDYNKLLILYRMIIDKRLLYSNFNRYKIL